MSSPVTASTKRTSIQSEILVLQRKFSTPKRGKYRARSSGSGMSAGEESRLMPSLDPKKLMTPIPYRSCHPGPSEVAVAPSRTDPSQARQVDRREHRLVGEQHPQQRRRRYRVCHALGLDLPEENSKIERVVLYQYTSGAEPRQEHSVDSGHVDHRERVQQDVADDDVGSVDRGPADGQPLVVRTWDPLRFAFGPGGPTDRHRIVGVVGIFGDSYIQFTALCFGGRPRTQPHDAGRKLSRKL